jgi:Putative peptidoglycan binding domain
MSGRPSRIATLDYLFLISSKKRSKLLTPLTTARGESSELSRIAWLSPLFLCNCTAATLCVAASGNRFTPAKHLALSFAGDDFAAGKAQGEPPMALGNPRFSSNAELAAAAENNPPMKRGASGEGVTILQQALLDLGFAMPVSTRARGGLPDGIFGAETEAAVLAFQRQNKLLADGVAGRMTLNQLERSIRLLSETQQLRYRNEYAAASRNGGMFG